MQKQTKKILVVSIEYCGINRRICIQMKFFSFISDLLFCCRLWEGALLWWDCARPPWQYTRLCTLQQHRPTTVQLMLQNIPSVVHPARFSSPYQPSECPSVQVKSRLLSSEWCAAVWVWPSLCASSWRRYGEQGELFHRPPPNFRQCHCLLEFCVPSLGRFFTLLHRETVVVNRWFTCFPCWHSCTANTCSAASLTCVTFDRNVLEHWSKGCGRKLETTSKKMRRDLW